MNDDELINFEAEGLDLPPTPHEQGYLGHGGALIWYAAYGIGKPVILLHGGLGHSGNWGNQVPALVEAGYRAVVIDSRGHGRSTRDDRLYSYEMMATDVLAVMDTMRIERAALVGWSDGAVIAMMLADSHPERVAGVFYFACNMDPSGAKEFEMTPVVGRCFNRHVQDYARLSATPDGFEAFSQAVGEMQRTQPNYTAEDLARINVPVAIVHSEHDEFIRREHAEYLARTIPGAEFVLLEGVSHFAPVQRPGVFNEEMLGFLHRIIGSSTLTPGG